MPEAAASGRTSELGARAFWEPVLSEFEALLGFSSHFDGQ